ncbi:fasciclin-3-like isoform X2 [Anopheles aquasalis]|uniref:fasciclin-3-like isoform X2 n=1 Tax=Anopheles aquasalis TaxID=42839 RepID=UPI00215ADBE0|nr:fasciclin-3-like isoform X2 [Anopheles aquasalis]
MQTKMQALFLSCLAVCAAFTVLASAQRVDTDPSAITVVENQENVTLHCRVGSPAKLCLINLPGLSQQIQLDANEPSPVPGIQYHGEGVERGSCGVRIARITADNAGIMNCTLFVNGIGQTGSIDITVAFPPEQPTINVVSDGDIGNLVVDSTLTFECTAARGNPAANISWLLDNEPIYEQVHPQKPEEQFDESSNKRYFTAQSILVRTIRAEDNGKRLTCQAQHMAYPQGVSNTDLVLNVNFQPQALQDQVIYGLQVGRTSVATVTIISNPPPTIFWNIDGIDYHQGTENGRFAVPIPEPLGNNRYNVSLTIAGLTLEDLSRTYTLRASNAFGSEDYRVFLRSQGDATINESSSIGIGEIVGLVLAVLIVLTAIALIFVARATGRWCFRGAGSSTSTSAAKIGETDTTDNGVGETMLSPPNGSSGNAAAASTTTNGNNNGAPFDVVASSSGAGAVVNTSLLRPNNLRYPIEDSRREPQLSVNSNNFDNASVLSSDSSTIYGYGGGYGGDPNQVGLPPSAAAATVAAQKRWIPQQQRELLEKQAQLLLSGASVRRKRETEIF